MNDDDHLNEWIRDMERVLRRPLTPEEREILEIMVTDPLTVLKRQMMNRQGTKIPDFDAVYRYKSEMDRKCSGGGSDSPPAPQL
jgi:hypothetical protein